MYRIIHVGHCGIVNSQEKFDDLIEARDAVAALIVDLRQDGFTVTSLGKERGKERRKDSGLWEVLEPEDCALVPDECGTIRLTHITFECRECGYPHETKQESLDCCQEEYRCYEEEEELYA